MTNRYLRGAGTAIVTPFTANGGVDESALRAFVNWQVEQGIDYVVPCGSTGEAATMSLEEQRRVVDITVEVVNGRVPVVAGAGSSDTKKAIELSKMMKDAGATHLLHTSPSYNRPPQRGIIAHYEAILDAIDLPIVVYNVPSRTGSNVEAATTLHLAKHPNVIAVKEASGNLAQIAQIIRERPDNFSVLSGDDGLTLAIMAAGGDGVISVTSNIVPALVASLVRAALEGDLRKAKEIDDQLAPLTSAAFVEPNPIAVKAALSYMNKMQNVLRLPLVSMLDQHAPVVRSALQSIGVLTA